METKTYAAPISGTPIFQLEADIAVPARTNINQLRARFAEIQREENIDIDFSRGQNLAEFLPHVPVRDCLDVWNAWNGSNDWNYLICASGSNAFLLAPKPQAVDQPGDRQRHRNHRDAGQRQFPAAPRPA